ARPVRIGRLLRAELRDRERERRDVLGYPTHHRDGQRRLLSVGGARLDEVAIRVTRQAAVVDVLPVPVGPGVPRVAELPVVAARLIAAPPADARGDVELLRALGLVGRGVADAVDARADRLGLRA